MMAQLAAALAGLAGLFLPPLDLPPMDLSGARSGSTISQSCHQVVTNGDARTECVTMHQTRSQNRGGKLPDECREERSSTAAGVTYRLVCVFR